ncbi:acyl carrier protein [Streptomyces sp. DSM 110735]|uniref:acyl carrier protein n=1 Tax=Streptomyces sp. DSM 110735 TaxID=2775031 RepID=UPI0018F6A152|nr:acyl carrier protein [Streptomyces sp. DSM 110735]MBJ7901759.1 hypothetical protein [Streptomyces sp. DSM 110735]
MSTGLPSSLADRYVLTVSAGSAESLTAHARGLAAFLSGGPRSGRRAFPRSSATLPGVAATLLNFRQCAPYRLALSAATVAEAADKLIAFTEHAVNPKSLAPQGLYANVIHTSTFDGDAVEGQDRNYLLGLAASARHDQLARLWSVGFPVDWRHVYPELVAERPVYLPPAPLDRRRYWPETPEAATTTEAAALPDGDAAEQVQPVGSAQPGNEPSQLVADLTGLPTALRVRRLCGYLQAHIAGLLDYPEGEHPHTDIGFFDLGMSSLHLGQVRQSIIADTAFEPSATSAFDHPTIADFAAYLERELTLKSEPGTESATPVAPTAAPAVTKSGQPLLLHTLGQDDIDRLSAHDLERAVIEVLS